MPVQNRLSYGTISIHAPREGGDSMAGRYSTFLRAISIHAPREGGDAQISRNTPSILRISIHAPREGGDLGLISAGNTRNVFQSTPPARGATL